MFIISTIVFFYFYIETLTNDPVDFEQPAVGEILPLVPKHFSDTVSRDGLWKNMAKFGCPPRFIAMMRQFHDGMQARVQNDGEYSEPFPVTSGVKQSCVMVPTLFNMIFSAMLTCFSGM